MSTEKTIYLIDGTAYIYRAFHAVQNLRTSKGLPTNAAFGFTRMLIKLMQDRKPEYAVMFFDAKGKTFRHEMYPEYKANRPPMDEAMIPQIPYIKKITEAFNIPMMEKQGFEADDLIGTTAKKAAENGFRVVMVTGDKDFMQLVTEKVTIWDPMKDKVTGPEEVVKKTGLPPEKIVDMMSLTGDTSDNVPGVPGIGPKTAQKLFTEYESLEDLLENVDKLKQKKVRENLKQYKDNALISKDLVRIDTHVEIDMGGDDFTIHEPDNKALAALFSELEFRQLQQEFSESEKAPEKTYRCIQDEESLNALAKTLLNADLISLDTETTSTNPHVAKLVGLSFSITPHEAYYIPVGHTLSMDLFGTPEPDENGVHPHRQLPMDFVLKTLVPVLESPDIPKTGQNIKYDWIVLENHGIDLKGVVFDTMVGSYLINPSKRAHNLDQIALDFLGHKTITYEDVAGKGKKGMSFDKVPIPKAVTYACEDADITLLAHQLIKKQVDDMGLTRLMDTVEVPLIPVLKGMEATGICVDEKRLRELSDSFADQLTGIEENIYDLAGMRFNIKSSQQLGEVLFEKLNLPVQKKTKKKTGYSTDVEVLTALSPMHELPALVLRHRTLAKLKSTYTDALLDLMHPKTGRIHTSFNQTVAATGRLSSSDPNLQNIPIRTEEGRSIRSAFVPKKGWKLIAADYSQVELRILAHYSDDPILIKAFTEGEDIHTRTASEVFGVPVDEVTADTRRHAKAVNFGIIYGMSAFGLSKDLGITQKMAKTYIDNYFERYSGVKRFIDETIKKAKETERTETLLGRIRYLPDIKSKNRNVSQFAERMAVNTPIQGTAADFIKLAMINMDKALKDNNMASTMLLSVHDEMIFEAPPEEVDALKSLTKTVMENVWELKAPLKVNVEAGDNWAEAH